MQNLTPYFKIQNAANLAQHWPCGAMRHLVFLSELCPPLIILDFYPFIVNWDLFPVQVLQL